MSLPRGKPVVGTPDKRTTVTVLWFSTEISQFFSGASARTSSADNFGLRWEDKGLETDLDQGSLGREGERGGKWLGDKGEDGSNRPGGWGRGIHHQRM